MTTLFKISLLIMFIFNLAPFAIAQTVNVLNTQPTKVDTITFENKIISEVVPNKRQIQLEKIKSLRQKIQGQKNPNLLTRKIGGESVGGGVGLLCNPYVQKLDINDIRSADVLEKSNLRIIDLMATASYMRFEPEQGYLQPEQGEKPVPFLKRILDSYYAKYFPAFVEKIKRTLDEINLDWEVDAGQLATIEDEITFFPWKNCQKVQIVVRHSFVWQENETKKSAVVTEVDHAYLNMIRRLGPHPDAALDATFTEAQLLLHEALYHIANEQGYHTPEAGTHWIVAALLSKKLVADLDQIKPEYRSIYFKRYLKTYRFSDNAADYSY